MIKNERQYRISRARAREFAEAVRALDSSSFGESGIHPLLLKARRDAAYSQFQELEEQLLEYEALAAGERPVLELESISELPKALIKARIASGLTQNELAEKLGLKPQQIQRYEATDYSAANLARIQEIAQALGVSIWEEVLIPNKQFSIRELWSTIAVLGLPKELVLKRFIPSWLRERVEQVRSEGTDLLDEAVVASSVLSFVARTFGLTTSALLGPRLPALDFAAVHTARFKATYAAHEGRLSAYAVYAHVLALLTLEATKHLEPKPIPQDPSVLRAQILEQYGEITFETALDHVWSLGVPVLPLRDPAAFHGACWRVGGRNVIVLKQMTSSAARWLNDLLHETRHAAEEQELAELAVIETSPISPDRHEAPRESVADAYAEEVVFGGRADELAQLCVEKSSGGVERLKQAVVDVARSEEVNLGALANHLAFRLSAENNINWWGAAQNLQQGDRAPWQHARDVFLMRINFSSLNEFDQDLLMRALAEDEEHES